MKKNPFLTLHKWKINLNFIKALGYWGLFVMAAHITWIHWSHCFAAIATDLTRSQPRKWFSPIPPYLCIFSSLLLSVGPSPSTQMATVQPEACPSRVSTLIPYLCIRVDSAFTDTSCQWILLWPFKSLVLLGKCWMLSLSLCLEGMFSRLPQHNPYLSLSPN